MDKLWIKFKNKVMRGPVSNPEVLKVVFRKNPKNNKISILINVGKSVLERCALINEKRVNIFTHQQNKRVLLIQKTDSKGEGFRISPVKKQPNFFKINFTCWLTENDLKPEDMKMHEVLYEVALYKIIVDLGEYNEKFLHDPIKE